VSTLSIFVDESGDFGAHSDYYVVALVMHNQDDDLSDELAAFADALRLIEGFVGDRVIHTGPAIRRENGYAELPVEIRKREVDRLFAFARRVPVVHVTFSFRKRQYPERPQLKAALFTALARFLRDHAAYFLSFDQVIVYYDNGQAEVTAVLNALFRDFFFEIDFRRADSTRYRLLQVADLHCTLELLRIKLKENRLSKSDLYFFGSRRRLQKDYLNKLDHKRLNNPIIA